MPVTVPPKGSRGAFFPRSLARLANGLVVHLFRRRGGARTQGGVHSLVLETRGAKSGQIRQAVLGYIEEATDSWLVIASAAGASRHSAWLHNLAGQPEATVEFGDGHRVEVRAESLEGADLAPAWERIAVDAPEYLNYRSKTDRDIPIIRLRRR